MMIVNELDLDTIHLDRGAHQAGGGAYCFMEAAAYAAGEPWTDQPACVSLDG